MVKTKQQKANPKKSRPHVKKRGKQADLTKFCAQLDALGLKIIQVTADGNCFFRSLADQLEGSEEEHVKYRSMVVQYIMKNREMFEPFIEDDATFDEYCQSMEKDGTWAGNLELQAASLVTHINICIHRFMSPRWYIRNFDQSEAHMVHLSYHDGEHYNSVRLKEDPCDGPARPILIKADADLSATSHQGKSVSSKSNGESGKDGIDTASIKLVMSGSGCNNAVKVEEVLLQVDGDVDAAIEYLVVDQGTDNQSAENDSLSSHKVASYECQENNDGGNFEQSKEETVKRMNKHDSSDDGIKDLHDNKIPQADDKTIPRNKVCPCGSRKKYKACCGAIKGRSSTKFAAQTIDARKSRKGRKHGKRGPAESVPPSGSIGGPPDVGALCI